MSELELQVPVSKYAGAVTKEERSGRSCIGGESWEERFDNLVMALFFDSIMYKCGTGNKEPGCEKLIFS